jgi:hypothetical protein
MSDHWSHRKRDHLNRFASEPKSHEWLLDYPCVKKWIDEYESEHTINGFLHYLKHFCLFYDTKPDVIVKDSVFTASFEILNRDPCSSFVFALK